MTYLEFLFSGGIIGNIIIFILFFLSVISVYIFFKKYMQINLASGIDFRFKNQIFSLLEKGEIEDVIQLCRKKKNMFASVLKEVLSRNIGSQQQKIKDNIDNSIQRELIKLETNISTLASIAGGAPMIGFLGTVIGMIMAFYRISAGAGNVEIEMLSQGIYTAMFTTAIGLVVGIFAYFTYNFLVSKIQNISTKLELEVIEILDKTNIY